MQQKILPLGVGGPRKDIRVGKRGSESIFVKQKMVGGVKNARALGPGSYISGGRLAYRSMRCRNLAQVLSVPHEADIFHKA